MFKDYLKSDITHARDTLVFVLFLVIFVVAIIVSQLYKPQIVDLGIWLLGRFDKSSIYLGLFIISALSSTLLPLPVWIYVVTCVALGVSYVECSLVVGLGASAGSASSYILGRCFRHTPLVKRRLNEKKIKNLKERSSLYCGFVLFLGSISPVPMDTLYLVSGFIQFPALSFLFLVTTGRVIRYLIIGHLFFLTQ